MDKILSRRSLLGLAVGAMVPWAAGLRLSAQGKPQMTVYKSSTCGCCSKWVEHMQANGFEMKAIDVDDIDKVKRERGVPDAAVSCHTGIISGYIVEGHMPATAVKKMLAEKPAIVGIAVPGMPMGSPGMEVPSGQKESSTSSRSTRPGRSRSSCAADCGCGSAAPHFRVLHPSRSHRGVDAIRCGRSVAPGRSTHLFRSGL
ncbi:MAG: DUF411 domain-containing protein [Vicinamibacterales bacterium]